MAEKKIEEGQKAKLYFNDKGEIIDFIDFPATESECNRVISFCCTTTVPDGFFLDFNITNVGVCIDTSELSCCLETRTTMCEVFNPCDGVLNCPVDIQAVRLVGCSRLFVNVGDLLPISGLSPINCSICCNTTTCVDQVIAFTCDKIPPCKPCFKIIGGVIGFDIVIDDCGRQVLVVKLKAVVEFIGCDC